MVQAITIELKNGLRVTGAYFSPVTKGPTMDKFLTDTLRDNGQKHIIVGDLNARSRNWDKGKNARGSVVEKVVRDTDRTYIVAGSTPSFYKVIRNTLEDGTIKLTELSSNPDICISRIQGTTSIVENKHWKDITDHRPLIVQLPMKLEISDVRKRVAKSLFHSPTTQTEIRENYKDAIPVLTGKLRDAADNGEQDADTLQNIYKEIQTTIVAPWEKNKIETTQKSNMAQQHN